MRAERNRRAAILTAEGTKQSQILEAEGSRQSSILKAEGDAKAQVLRAQGEAEAIATVFNAIHAGDPDPKLLAYQYLQTLPKIADGSANTMWIIPSELTEALKGIGQGFFAPRDPNAPGWTPTEAPKVSEMDVTPDLASTVDLEAEPDLGFPTVTTPGETGSGVGSGGAGAAGADRPAPGASASDTGPTTPPATS